MSATRLSIEEIGNAGTTITDDSTDAAQSLTTDSGVPGQVTDAKNTKKNVLGVLLTCETNAIRFSFTATPTTSLGHILYAGQSYLVTGYQNIINLEFLSAVTGAHGTLMITPFYRP